MLAGVVLEEHAEVVAQLVAVMGVLHHPAVLQRSPTHPKSNTSFTAYHTDMLLRVVRNTILGASPRAKRSLNAIKVTLNEYVSKCVTRVRALRVCDFSLKEMYGKWASGQISCISCYSSCIV